MKQITLTLAFLGLTLSAWSQYYPEDSLTQWYSDAVLDAQNPLPEEVVNTLFPASPYNPHLVTKLDKGELYIRVVSWISWGDTVYYPRKDWNSYVTGQHRMWVTLAPQMQDACSDADWVGPAGLDLRLEMALGLPPNNGKDAMLELWIRPQDLYRPCPDADPTDTGCGLNFPAEVTLAHRTWINNLRASQFFQGDCHTAYPWTMLGYTYDWHPNNDGHVGFSEYVIYPESAIQIIGWTATADYCKR